MTPKKTKTSAGMETVDETVARAQAQIAAPTEQLKAVTDIAAARANLNAGGVRQGNAITTPKNGTPVVTPASLEPSNVPVVTPAPTLTAAPKLQADLEAVQEDALTQKVAAEKTAAEATKGTAFQSYLDQLKEAKGLTTLTSEAYAEKGGVNDITPELNDINDQIRREQLAMRRAIEGTQGQGMIKAGSAAAIANIQRESLAKQADLSIIQMAVQGRYDSAKEIADRAVSAQFEEQTKKTEVAKFDYTENKELFTKAEQRQYDMLFTDRQNKIEQAKQDASDIKQFALSALQAGASTAEVQKAMGAKTLDEAISLVGGYLRPTPVAKTVKAPDLQNFGTADSPIWKEFNPATGAWQDVQGVSDGQGGAFKKVTPQEIQDLNQAEIGRNSVNTLIDSLKQNIKDNGTQVLFGKDAGTRTSAKTSLLLAMKGLEKTGALDAGTIDVLSGAIPSNEFWATEDAQIASLEQLKKTVNDKTTEFQDSYRGTTAEIDPRTQRIYKDIRAGLLPEGDVSEIKGLLGGGAATTAAFTPESYYK